MKDLDARGRSPVATGTGSEWRVSCAAPGIGLGPSAVVTSDPAAGCADQQRADAAPPATEMPSVRCSERRRLLLTLLHINNVIAHRRAAP